MILLHIVALLHNYKCPAYQFTGMSSSTSETRGNTIKRIPVKEPTRRVLHVLKDTGQSYDDLLTVIIRREREYRDWKMITGIDRDGDFVAFRRVF